MKEIEVHRHAQREIGRAADNFRTRGIKPVTEFLNAVAEVLERIRLHPERGAPIYGPHRWMQLEGYRYVAYYRQIRDGLTIVYSVAHASRRPGYWLRRTRRP